MTIGIEVGPGLNADQDVLIGYHVARDVDQHLTLGGGANLRSGTVIYVGSEIGERFETGHHVIVREQCRIGDDVSLWSNTVVDYGCRLGSRVKIHSNCYVAQHTEIDDDAFLAPGVTLANDLYPGQADSARLMSGPRIGAGAQLGVNVTVLPFVRIGEGTLVGAGSVVTRDLPAGVVAYGNPATIHGEVSHLADVAGRVQEDATSFSRYRFVNGSLGRSG
ncbi:acyltransferase [Nocardioides iriomotensis]|uniref:N-acetyltransferase n=1 Tax=Nocardioides iriomotensis TaxID=715784 RepID=A0A4Q5JC47_9ACTN|nr:acyltransferase [Nocardioides iriomotensis]RYU15639.1 N-acetyltransferase [Nocardioides iriomotensis]